MSRRPGAYADAPESCDQWERGTGAHRLCKLCGHWCNCGSMGCNTREDGGTAAPNAAAEAAGEAPERIP